jgi:hypothetical protein
MIARFWVGKGKGPGPGVEDFQAALLATGLPGVYERISAIPAGVLSVRPLLRTVHDWKIWMTPKVAVLPSRARNCIEAQEACEATKLEEEPSYAGACLPCREKCRSSCTPGVGCTWPKTNNQADSCQYWLYEPHPPYPAGYSAVGTPGPFPGSEEACVSWPDATAVSGVCTYVCGDDLECMRPASNLEQPLPRTCFGNRVRGEMDSCERDYFCSNTIDEPIEMDDPLNPAETITVCVFSCHGKICLETHAWGTSCQVRTRLQMDRGCAL